jgi:hypothetical protein
MRETADLEAVHLMHTVKLLRNAIFAFDRSNFNGSFGIDSQINSVPPVLLTFVNMLLEGPSYIQSTVSQSALSISQLVAFNSVKRPRLRASNEAQCNRVSIRHSPSQETPMPIYVGLMLHSATRKKKLVDKCNMLGLSVSYDRVMQISNKVANSVCSQYRQQQLVCPPSVKEGIFTVAAADNIDHNLSSATASTSFHGTAISLIQMSNEKQLVCNGLSSFESASDAPSDIVLPDSYTNVSPCILQSGDPKIPKSDCTISYQTDITKTEYKWLEFVHESLNNAQTANLSWAAYHASMSNAESRAPSVSAILPLFRDNAHSAAMIKHSLSVVKAAVGYKNVTFSCSDRL